MSRLKYFLFALALAVIPSSFIVPVFASAETQPESQASLCSQEIPCGLNFKKRGARPRWLEVQPFVGEYLGDSFNNSWAAGGRVGVRVTDAITVGAEVVYSKMSYDNTSAYGATVQNRNIFITDAYGIYSFPILQRAGKSLQEMDLFTTLGLGNIRVNNTNNLVGLVGGGLRMYFKPNWLGLRIDVNTYMYGLNTPTGTKFVDDWVFTAGPDFFFFPKKLKESK